MALVTLTQFAGWLQRGLDQYEAYTAQLAIDAVTGEVTDLCGWHIAPSLTETVTVDGSGSEVQGLPTLHLTALTSVTELGTAVDVADIDWSADGSLARRESWWTNRRRGVVAEIEHGYAATPPALVALICGASSRAMANPGGVVQERSGGESVTYTYTASGTPSVLTKQERRILERRYQIPGRP